MMVEAKTTKEIQEHMSILHMKNGLKDNSFYDKHYNKRWTSNESLEKELKGMLRLGGDQRAGAYNQAIKDILNKLKGDE